MNNNIIAGCRVEVFENSKKELTNLEYVGTVIQFFNSGWYPYLLILKDNGDFKREETNFCRLKKNTTTTESERLKIANRFDLMDLDKPNE